MYCCDQRGKILLIRVASNHSLMYRTHEHVRKSFSKFLKLHRPTHFNMQCLTVLQRVRIIVGAHKANVQNNLQLCLRRLTRWLLRVHHFSPWTRIPKATAEKTLHLAFHTDVCVLAWSGRELMLQRVK